MTDLAGVIVFQNAANGATGSRPENHAQQQPDNRSVDYLLARERAERAAAKRASSLAARHLHQELAQHYAELARRAG